MSYAAVSDDARLATAQALLDQLIASDATAPDHDACHGDSLDHLIDRVNQVAALLERQRAQQQDTEQRANELLTMMMHMAAQDYTVRVAVSDDDSLFDALATGLNILADELAAAQDTRARLQEEIIQTQATVIQELSTPIIPIQDDILVMPLIGSIDSLRAQHVLERLLEGVAASRAHTIILDITGVAVVDTQVANALIRAAQAVKLLGAQVILTGIRPEVAQTLVGLGIDLSAIVTLARLQNGIAFAIKQSEQSARRR